MKPSFLKKPGRFEPPLRRVLAVDAGTRCLRLLLLERRFGWLRVLKQEALDLHEEGLVSPEELKAHVHAIVEKWGRPPVALALPQHVAVAQILDLPAAPESESRQLIEAETVKLGGVSESAIVYDFVRVPAPAESRHRFWVTFCQEGEIESRIAQLGLEGEDFREITTAANALLTAWQVMHPQTRHAVLVHGGAQNTTVVIVRDGTAVFAASFSMGGDFFTRAIARLRACPVETAENLKRRENLLEDATRLPGFAEVVDGWAAELKRQVNEWHEHQPGATREPAALTPYVSGAVFDQAGLLDYLNARSGLKFHRWATQQSPDAVVPATGFEIALGTALQALGQGAQPVSLLPASRRAGWHNRLGRQRLEFASSLLLLIVLVALGFGIWQKVALIRQKQALQTKVDKARESAQANRAYTEDLLDNFDLFRPMFERQQNTTDLLHTLGRLQLARSNQNYWCVLFADQQSYFSHSAETPATNKPAAPLDFVRVRSIVTNTSPVKPGCIAELCVPEDSDTARQVLSALVGELKKDPTYARVDLLSEDLRRKVADPTVILPEKYFALALDFAANEFQPPAQPRKTRGPAAPRATSRSAFSADTANPP